MARRQNRQVERLVAAEHAARIAGEMGGRWWRELTQSASTARTDGALDDLFRTALATLKQAMEADAVSLLLANEAGDELVARAASGLSEETTFDLGIRMGQGMAGQVLTARRSIVFEDISTIQVVSPVLRHSGLRSVAAVPLLFEDRLLGVLYAGSRKPNEFTGTDVELLELLADQLAGAMERVRAFEEERQARSRAERDADHLERLQRITSRLHAATGVGEIAAALAVSLSADAQDAAVAWSNVWLVGEDHLELVPTPGGGGLPLTEPHRSLPFDRFVKLADVVASKRPVFVSDEQSTWALGEPLVRASWAALPLVVKGECAALTIVAYPGHHQFEEDEVNFLLAVTGQAAQAMDRIRLEAEQFALAEISRFFARVGRAIAEGSDFTDTLNRLAAMALPVVGDVCLIDVVGEDGNPHRMVARHRRESLQPRVDRLRSDYAPDPGGHHPAMDVIGTGRTRWSDRMSDEFLRETTRDEGHFELVKELGFRSYVSVPLDGESEVLGALTLVSTTRPFGPKDVTFAEQLAGNVAAVLDNARRYERAMRTSHTLQQSLLPKRLPAIEGLLVQSVYLPATRGLEVGGDFYDLVELPEAVGFMVGDVAGHDREAAAMMGHLRSAARTLAGQLDSPASLLAALQDSWSLLGFDRIATGLFGRLDPRTGEVVLASAGHYPPLLVGQRTAEYLAVPPGVPLGSPGARARDVRFRLTPGELLVLFTDGAIDEREVGIDEGMAALMKAALGGETTPAAACDRIVSLLPDERSDDVALLALRRDGLGTAGGADPVAQ